MPRTSNVRPIEGGVNTDTEEGEPTTDSATGRVSPYLLVNKNLDVSMYESVGLLYASSLKAKDNRLVGQLQIALGCKTYMCEWFK